LIEKARRNENCLKLEENASKLDENENDRMKVRFLCEPILNSEEKYSDREIRDQILTLLIAASDTTSNLVGASLMFLAINQEIQKKVHDEISEVFSDGDDYEINYERLNNLRYLEKVMKETLRLFSPLPISARECLDDCDIGIGCVVKKGTKIILLNHILHRRVDIWGPNSHKFDPENFSDDNVLKRDPYSFIPFGSVSIQYEKFLYFSFKSFCREPKTALEIVIQ
jgi:cytochrome P450